MADKEAAPYAPVDNALKVMRRLRERGLPDPLTQTDLERIGVPKGNAPRTYRTLKFLNLIDASGAHQPNLLRLSRASSAEYQGILAEILREAYAPVFTLVDPSEDSETDINDAFRHYNPPAQRERMVTLFLGLCREAGMVPGGPVKRKSRTRKTIPITFTHPPKRQDADYEAPVAPPAATLIVGEGPDYRMVSTLLQQLPRDGRWTRAKKDKWLDAVRAAVEFLTDVTDEDAFK